MARSRLCALIRASRSIPATRLPSPDATPAAAATRTPIATVARVIVESQGLRSTAIPPNPNEQRNPRGETRSVSPERVRLAFRTRSQVPELDLARSVPPSSGADQGLAVRGEGHALDPGPMPLQVGDPSPRGGIPQLDLARRAVESSTGGQQPAVGREGQAENAIPASPQDPCHFAGFPIPEPDFAR